MEVVSPSDLTDPIALRAYAVAILRRSNTFLPVYALPPEVLNKIFVLCADKEWLEKRTDHSRFAVAQVSHYWRAVAVATPDLWSHIAVNDHNIPSKVRKLLERAGMLPLTLSVQFGGSNSPIPVNVSLAAANAVLDLLPRAVSLHVAMPRKVFDSLTWPLSASASMQQLKITGRNLGSPRPLAGLMDTLPARFPQLQALEAAGFSFNLIGCRLPLSLTQLHIDNIYPDNAEADLVLAFLRTAPALQRLTLLFSSPALDVGLRPPPVGPPVLLNELEEFRLGGPGTICVPLLSGIQVPSSTRQKISLRFNWRDSYLIADCINVLIPQVKQIGGTFQTASISDEMGEGRYSLTVVAWKDALSDDAIALPQAHAGLSADLIYEFKLAAAVVPAGGREPPNSRPVKAVIPAFPFDSVRSLRLALVDCGCLDALALCAWMHTVGDISCYSERARPPEFLAKVLALLGPFENTYFEQLRTILMSGVSIRPALPLLRSVSEERGRSGAALTLQLKKVLRRPNGPVG
ncbi:hypothetical protein NM688_g6452 [Phlebia brevispora]|uniref:Uncharacterized protein n=1 Tax=Phlebia brevispora TaxID=194682 RepID=A0ACC1SG03_9APHY|nr:hypothetical protein NM688_g6452 [Phlebia brevispora]